MGRLSSGSHDTEEPLRPCCSRKEWIMRRVGIDLARRAPRRATVYEGAEQIGRPIRVERTMEGIDALVRRATAGAGDGQCEFIMEPTGLAWLPLAAELDRRGFRTFVPKAAKTAALR